MVCPTFPPQGRTCGVGDYTQYLVEALAGQGDRITLWTSSACRAEDTSVLRVLPRGQNWSLGEARELMRAFARHPVDVVHLQYTPDLYGPDSSFHWLPLLGRVLLANARTVITIHTLAGSTARSRATALLLLLTAHHVISANEEVSAMIRRRLPRLAKRMTEVPIGASLPIVPPGPDSRSAGRALLGLPGNAPLLVYFGMLYPGKGLETLIAALREVHRRRPGVRLAIVGDTRPEDCGYRQRLEDLARSLDVSQATLWVGRRPAEDVSAILRGADLLVLPFDGGVSTRHSTLVAGIAHGLPVISTRSALASAYLRDGDNLSLVPARDPQALAHRILTLLDCPTEAERLRRGARALAERFRWDRIAQETRTVYARVCRA
jgi:glycosyltransferase involved in cell wall biosynthesis